jgi:transcription elongation factor Elf1
MKLPEGIKDFNELAYITSRKLENGNGEKTGTVMMWRKKGEEEFGYELTCPYCATEQASSVVFTKRPYRVRCSTCNKSIMIEKLSKK